MRAQRGAMWCLLLGLLGIGLASYLVFLHLGLMRGELLGGAVCGGSGTFNCHVVTASDWSSFLGMPLALWGILGYVTVFALSLLGLQSPEWAAHALTLTFALAVLFIGIDLALLAVMAFVIRFYCLLCLLSYAINLTLLVISGRSLERPWPHAMGQLGASLAALVPSSRRPATGLFWGVMLMGMLGSVGVSASTTFVSRGSLGSVRKQIRDARFEAPSAELGEELRDDEARALEEENRNWCGLMKSLEEEEQVWARWPRSIEMLRS